MLYEVITTDCRKRSEHGRHGTQGTDGSGTCAGGFCGIQTVITSYSIHYTKLYDQESVINAVKTTAMITFIITGAAFLSQVVGFIGIARSLSLYISGLNLSPYLLIIVVGIMYLILGMILDGISIVVMTLPIVLPIVTAAGFQPLWFGIFIVFMVELSQITPPVGFSIFVIQGISDEKVGDILKATFPFFIIMILMVISYNFV